MRDFSKALLSTFLMIVCILLFSYIIIASNVDENITYDLRLRNELSGSLDFLIVGASHGQCALYTKTIDEELNVTSYNLSYNSRRNPEKKSMLNQELNRNDIKTVIFELSYDTFLLENSTISTDANIFSINSMPTFKERYNYFANVVKPENLLYIYSDQIYGSILAAKRKMLSEKAEIPQVELELKGSRLRKYNNYVLSNNKIVRNYNAYSIETKDFIDETVQDFTSLIKLCQSKGINVIVAVVPVSDNYLWKYGNLDEYNEWAKEYFKELGVDYYDFNLLKDRYNLFSDKDCYSTDTHHMSGIGAEKFTYKFTEILKMADEGKDVSELFYTGFEELKQDSPYMPYYLKNK